LKKNENVEKLPKIYEGWNKTEREGNQKLSRPVLMVFDLFNHRKILSRESRESLEINWFFSNSSQNQREPLKWFFESECA
jgi:hypothetical protein